MNPRPTRFFFSTAAARLLCFGLLATFSVEAGTVQTRDGRSLEGRVSFSAAGSLLVVSAQGGSNVIALTNVIQAQFAPGPFLVSGSVLPNGWSAQDIGDARGMVRLDEETFTLRVEGQSTNATACHFVHRPMPSDGEIIARVEQVGGTGPAQAGIMMRSLNSGSAFAALSRGRDGRLWFQRRAGEDRKETRLTPGPSVTAPVWLRLQKRDRQILASYSTDGVTWQPAGHDTTRLAYEKTSREYEGELPLLRANCGVFASAPGQGTWGTARVAQVSLTLHGLRGEYFADAEFKKLKLARLDPQIRFDWGLNAPDAALDKDRFSVRWTGRLLAPRTGTYSFHFEADDSARLWIGSKEMPPTRLRRIEKRDAVPTVSLMGGQLVDLKMEFQEGEGPASVRLAWALPNQTPEIILMTNFLCQFIATNSPEAVAAPRFSDGTLVNRGVVLRDGSFIAGPVTAADGSAVRLSLAGRKDFPVLNSKIARIILRPPRQALPFEQVGGRTGVFLKNGDFFEGEFHSLDAGSLNMSSVLFGLKRFWIEGGEAVAVVLNDFQPAPAKFEVRLLNGSILRATSISATDKLVTLHEPILGSLAIAVGELFEIRSVEKLFGKAAANVSTARP